MNKCDSDVGARRARTLVATLGLLLPALAAADTIDVVLPASLDLSEWACEYCAFFQGSTGEVEAGAGYVSDDSFKFGEYNGLKDSGAFLIGNATERYRNEKGEFLDLRIRDLGLDTRAVDLDAGRQGKYRLYLTYDEIPHYVSDTSKTPYEGAGGGTLQLPEGWVTAGSTPGMTELDASLRNEDLATDRTRLGIGIAFIPARKWETSFNFRREYRDGQLGGAGSFYFNSAQLIRPVDYITDELEAAVTYTTPGWQSRLGYYGSFFNDQNASLVWQNAYNPIVPGADAGQLALPPDNQFNQVVLSSGYDVSERTRISGNIAVGRMEQNEYLLPTSINPNVAVPLARTTAEAEIHTLTADLKADSAVNSKLRLSAAYRYNDRDNRTPSDVFDWVTTDAFAGPPRRNLPYSFTDNTATVGADYRFNGKTRLSGGYEHQDRERSNQEVRKTNEDTVWAKFSIRASEFLDLDLRAAHGDRDASGFTPVPEIDPAEDPLMRKFNMADRSRDTGSVHVGINPHERVSIGLDIDYSKDDYTNSIVGLTESRDTRYNADVTVMLTEVTPLNFFAGREEIKSDQVGSDTTGVTDWTAKNDDTFDTIGVGVKHELIKDKLDVGADYVHSQSTGEVSVATATPAGDFPDLETELNTLKLYADYRLKDAVTLRVAYWYEDYDSSDWMLDGVAPGTIPNVIAFGSESPHYTVNVVTVSARYRF